MKSTSFTFRHSHGYPAFVICALVTIGLVIGCVSCGGGRKEASADDAVGILAPVDENGLVTIDISAEYPKQEISLQTIADVEYIPLAISDKVLLKSSDRLFYLSDRYIMTCSTSTGEICVFDRAGEIVFHFNRKGRGPGEYFALGQVVFCEETEEFFILDAYQLTSKILVYSFDGKHKRTLPLPLKCDIEMWDFNAGLLLIYDKTGLIRGAEYSTIPYRLISKTDGSIIETLPIELPERYSETIRTEIKPSTQAGDQYVSHFSLHMIPVKNNRLGGKDFTLADLSSDSIYTFTRERVLTPAFVRTPSVYASEPRTVWSAELVTEDFIVFSIVSLVFGEGGEGRRSLKYDCNTGRVNDVTFFDENYQRWGSPTFLGEADRPINTEISTFNPLRLKEAQENGKLSGPLAEIAANLKEDDNPVVMIVKFKQKPVATRLFNFY